MSLARPQGAGQISEINNRKILRFFRDRKEQVIDGRIFYQLKAVLVAVTVYHDNWRLEWLGFINPGEYWSPCLQ